jgi:hypothetical protein
MAFFCEKNKRNVLTQYKQPVYTTHQGPAIQAGHLLGDETMNGNPPLDLGRPHALRELAGSQRYARWLDESLDENLAAMEAALAAMLAVLHGEQYRRSWGHDPVSVRFRRPAQSGNNLSQEARL